jgi:hypothetical protein
MKGPHIKDSTVAAAKPLLTIEDVAVDNHCNGSRWTAPDIDLLARIVAIIAMGQAAHAAHIIAELKPNAPAIDHAALRRDAKRRLSVHGKTAQQRENSKYQRDGLIFESISWAAAQQSSKGKALVRDPHLSSTTQGLDGLMLEIDAKNQSIFRATIFEDKCSEHPRAKFRDEILPCFKAHHENRRASDLVASAAALLARLGLDGTQAVKAAADVLDKKRRVYRGSLAVTTADDSTARRQAIFKGYEELKGIDPPQRLAATLVTSADLRVWFNALAKKALTYIDLIEAGDE